jgi:hypothetical protein
MSRELERLYPTPSLATTYFVVGQPGGNAYNAAMPGFEAERDSRRDRPGDHDRDGDKRLDWPEYRVRWNAGVHPSHGHLKLIGRHANGQ